MQINLPKANVGLGTSGIGDNFARARLIMAKQAGYVQNTPSPYSQPGTALKQYQSAAPVLSAIAKAQGQKGIPGLLRDGQLGRPPMGGKPPEQQSLINTPAPTFQSTVAGHAVGNPFAQLGQPQMPLNWFNRPGQNQLNAGQQPPHVQPGNISGEPYVPTNPPNQPGGTPGWMPRPGPPSPGGIVGPVPPGWVGPGGLGGGAGGAYPPGTVRNFLGYLLGGRY